MLSNDRFKTKMLFIFAIFITANFLWVAGSADDKEAIPKTIEELKTAIDSLLNLHRIPGAGIAFISKDSIMFMGGLGYADMENKIPVSEDIYFRMGSITKNFIAMGFLKLVEEGRIDLNTPVKDIVPEINIINPWRETDPVRVVHILEHTSGFGNSFREFNIDDDPEMPLGQALKVVNEALESRFRPGTCYSYSNAGYGLAGYILEKITGMRYEDYLKETVLNPLGMRSSTFRLADFKDSRFLARGYLDDFEEAPFVNFYSRSSGIMLSTVRDLAAYVQFLLNRGKVDGNQIVSEASIARMETPTSSVAAQKGLNFGYGLGMEQSYRKGYKWLGHNGAHFGFYSDFWYNSDLDIGYVALLNRFDMSACMYTIRNLLTEYLVREKDLAPAPAVQIPEERLEAYAGHYIRKNSTGELLGWMDLILGDATVSITGDTLYFRQFLDIKQPLIPVTSNLFREPDMPNASVIFFTTSDGKRAMVNWNSYYEETSSWKPLISRLLLVGGFLAMLTTIPYAIFWIPVHLFKKIKGIKNRSSYLRIRIVPLIAVVSLLYGSIVMANQNMIYIAQKNFINIQFTVITWLFAALSFLSLFYALYSFKKPVMHIARIYALVVSLSCVGVTLFFIYYGMIGLMLWA